MINEIIGWFWIASIVVTALGGVLMIQDIITNKFRQIGPNVSLIGTVCMLLFCILFRCSLPDEDIQKSINKKQQEIEVLQIELKYKENK